MYKGDKIEVCLLTLSFPLSDACPLLPLLFPLSLFSLLFLPSLLSLLSLFSIYLQG
jgi:hypothetical protein